MEFNDFLNKYKEEALQIDFKKEQRSANEILELKKMKLNNITFEYEIEEVIAFCEIAIIQTKETLNWVILNEHYKRKYKNGIPLFLSQIKGYFEYLELYQKAIDKKQQLPPQQIDNKNPDEVYKTQNLFKVGLLFAKGEMNKYFTVNSKNETVMNNEFTAPKIAKELGNDSYNKYILASINNYLDKENGNKNIFNSFDMMTKIISHCKAENISVDAYFNSRLPIK